MPDKVKAIADHYAVLFKNGINLKVEIGQTIKEAKEVYNAQMAGLFALASFACSNATLEIFNYQDKQRTSMSQSKFRLATLQQSLSKLDRNAEIIAVCHHGMRSADATGFLLQQGFGNVKNLIGGIDAWSTQVDSSVPRY